MKESLGARVGRIVSGSLNSLVDAVEDAAPELVMEQAIREVDGAISDVRAELGQVAAQKHLASKRLAEENDAHVRLAEQMAIAVKEGRDDLAEAAIGRQLDIEAQVPVLERAVADAGLREKDLESFIQALQAKKREMQDELRSFRSSREAVETSVGQGKGGNPEIRVDRARSAFDRVMENTTGLAAGKSSTDGKTAAQLAELEELSRNNRVKERLAAMKAKANT